MRSNFRKTDYVNCMNVKAEFLNRIITGGIDNLYKMCYIFCVNGCDEDTRSRKDSQRGCHLGARRL